MMSLNQFHFPSLCVLRLVDGIGNRSLFVRRTFHRRKTQELTVHISNLFTFINEWGSLRFSMFRLLIRLQCLMFIVHVPLCAYFWGLFWAVDHVVQAFWNRIKLIFHIKRFDVDKRTLKKIYVNSKLDKKCNDNEWCNPWMKAIEGDYSVNTVDDIMPEIKSFQKYRMSSVGVLFHSGIWLIWRKIQLNPLWSKLFDPGKYSFVKHSIADSLGTFSMWCMFSNISVNRLKGGQPSF